MTNKFSITEGTGTNIATHQINEDGVDKQIQRVVLSNSSGEEVINNQLPLLANSKGAYATSSFRMVGQIAAPANVLPFPAPLMTVRNDGTTPKAIRRLAVEVLHSAAAVDLALGSFRLFVNTGVTPSGGALADLSKLDTNYPNMESGFEVRFGATADGVNSVITHGIPPINPSRQQTRTAIFTAVGVMPQIDYELINYSQHPVIIQPGETCALILTSALIDVITRHYVVKAIFEDLI